MPFIAKKNILIPSWCIIPVFIVGCVDYMRIEDGKSLGNTVGFAPAIDLKHLSPHPSRLVETISVGKNCKGQIFKVPPIEDRNTNDRLFYLWFLDNRLAWPQSVIEPEARDSAIITFTVDEQFLLAHFQTKIPKDFFDRLHVIDFFVSDVEYAIPESRFIDDAKYHEKEHTDYAYWIVSFSNDPC